MEDQYGMADLRQYITGRSSFFPPPPPPPDLMSSHRGYPYDMLVFRSDSTNSAAPPILVNAAIDNIAGAASSSVAATSAGFGGFDSGQNCGGGGGDGSAGRWPRQETLTLLEIRSRLDPKFKEANQKGPLWDEVSRIMSEEHGYQRSGKKCREKFENLYKYYKKTKEGKAGRQDGKNYRFFRQLEALYGEHNNNNNNNNNNSPASLSEAHHHRRHIGSASFNHYNFPNKEPFNVQGSTDPIFLENTSLSLSIYSDTSSSDDKTDPDEHGSKTKKRSGRTCWRAKIKDFVDSQMKRLVERQEAWMEKMTATIEHKERERTAREEERRRQDVVRIEREREFWAGERAWVESRDAALIEALRKITGKEETNNMEVVVGSLTENRNDDDDDDDDNKGEMGVERENVFWEEIGNKMSCLGHDRRGPVMCKDKWDSVNNYLLKCSNKKRKENNKSCSYSYNNNLQTCTSDIHGSNQGGREGEGVYCEPIMRLSDQNITSPNNNNNGISESCLRYFMGDGYGRIME